MKKGFFKSDGPSLGTPEGTVFHTIFSWKVILRKMVYGATLVEMISGSPIFGRTITILSPTSKSKNCFNLVGPVLTSWHCNPGLSMKFRTGGKVQPVSFQRLDTMVSSVATFIACFEARVPGEWPRHGVVSKWNI